MRRRQVLARAGIVLLSPTAGCLGSWPGDGGPPDESPAVDQYVPDPSAVESFGDRLLERGYSVWDVDVQAIESQREENTSGIALGPSGLGYRLPLRLGLAHEDVSIAYEDVERMAFLGVPSVGAIGGGIDGVGQLAASITVGEFDDKSVEDSLSASYDREHSSGFRPRDQDYHVDDGTVLLGLSPFVAAIREAVEDEDARYVTTDRAVDRLLDDVAGTTFSVVSRHESREDTALENGRFAGQIAAGFGYAIDTEDPSFVGRLVFEDAAAIDDASITEWAEEHLVNVAEPAVEADDTVVEISGDVETDHLAFTTFAHLPFVMAHNHHTAS